eukprot:snap_masked-scaffold_10-processed-gene-7.12-mRNA-1 protein AED:1.00 eAED:1.00 QI:0/0/0/0/1/1/2/0/1607
MQNKSELKTFRSFILEISKINSKYSLNLLSFLLVEENENIPKTVLLEIGLSSIANFNILNFDDELLIRIKMCLTSLEKLFELKKKLKNNLILKHLREKFQKLSIACSNLELEFINNIWWEQSFSCLDMFKLKKLCEFELFLSKLLVSKIKLISILKVAHFFLIDLNEFQDHFEKFSYRIIRKQKFTSISEVSTLFIFLVEKQLNLENIFNYLYSCLQQLVLTAEDQQCLIENISTLNKYFVLTSGNPIYEKLFHFTQLFQLSTFLSRNFNILIQVEILRKLGTKIKVLETIVNLILKHDPIAYQGKLFSSSNEQPKKVLQVKTVADLNSLLEKENIFYFVSDKHTGDNQIKGSTMLRITNCFYPENKEMFSLIVLINLYSHTANIGDENSKKYFLERINQHQRSSFETLVKSSEGLDLLINLFEENLDLIKLFRPFFELLPLEALSRILELTVQNIADNSFEVLKKVGLEHDLLLYLLSFQESDPDFLAMLDDLMDSGTTYVDLLTKLDNIANYSSDISNKFTAYFKKLPNENEKRALELIRSCFTKLEATRQIRSEISQLQETLEDLDMVEVIKIFYFLCECSFKERGIKHEKVYAIFTRIKAFEAKYNKVDLNKFQSYYENIHTVEPLMLFFKVSLLIRDEENVREKLKILRRARGLKFNENFNPTNLFFQNKKASKDLLKSLNFDNIKGNLIFFKNLAKFNETDFDDLISSFIQLKRKDLDENTFVTEFILFKDIISSLKDNERVERILMDISLENHITILKEMTFFSTDLLIKRVMKRLKTNLKRLNKYNSKNYREHVSFFVNIYNQLLELVDLETFESEVISLIEEENMSIFPNETYCCAVYKILSVFSKNTKYIKSKLRSFYLVRKFFPKVFKFESMEDLFDYFRNASSCSSKQFNLLFAFIYHEINIEYDWQLLELEQLPEELSAFCYLDLDSLNFFSDEVEHILVQKASTRKIILLSTNSSNLVKEPRYTLPEKQELVKRFILLYDRAADNDSGSLDSFLELRLIQQQLLPISISLENELVSESQSSTFPLVLSSTFDAQNQETGLLDKLLGTKTVLSSLFWKVILIYLNPEEWVNWVSFELVEKLKTYPKTFLLSLQYVLSSLVLYNRIQVALDLNFRSMSFANRRFTNLFSFQVQPKTKEEALKQSLMNSVSTCTDFLEKEYHRRALEVLAERQNLRYSNLFDSTSEGKDLIRALETEVAIEQKTTRIEQKGIKLEESESPSDSSFFEFEASSESRKKQVQSLSEDEEDFFGNWDEGDTEFVKKPKDAVKVDLFDDDVTEPQLDIVDDVFGEFSDVQEESIDLDAENQIAHGNLDAEFGDESTLEFPVTDEEINEQKEDERNDWSDNESLDLDGQSEENMLEPEGSELYFSEVEKNSQQEYKGEEVIRSTVPSLNEVELAQMVSTAAIENIVSFSINKAVSTVRNKIANFSDDVNEVRSSYGQRLAAEVSVNILETIISKAFEKASAFQLHIDIEQISSVVEQKTKLDSVEVLEEMNRKVARETVKDILSSVISTVVSEHALLENNKESNETASHRNVHLDDSSQVSIRRDSGFNENEDDLMSLLSSEKSFGNFDASAEQEKSEDELNFSDDSFGKF